MTTEFVLRLDRKRAEHFKQEARKRRKTPNALVRQALDNFIGEPTSDRKGKATKPKRKGAGWPARLKHLRKLDREYGKKLPILDIVEQFRAIDLNGCK